MKNYKKGLLALMVLSAMSLMAAEEKTIEVNTFEDENGENLDNCSLREAIFAAHKNAAFGGCSAGDTNSTQADIIQLKEGTYKLTRGELKPESAVDIRGATRYNYDQRNVLTDAYPAYEDLKTFIVGDGIHRIFNTAQTFANLDLTDVALKNGKADLGGAIFSGGNLSLNRSAILDSTAVQAGGAIYALAQNGERTLTINSTLLQGNKATKGSVLAMDCVSNMSDSKPVLSLLQSSIIKNGATDNQSILDFCGNVSATISTNTIAQNIANPNNGSVIKAISEGNNLLSQYSNIVLANNTIVENDAYTGLYYDKNGTKQLGFNVFAYNGKNIANSKSCRFINNAKPDDELSFIAFNNALELSASKCDLPKSALDEAVDDYKNVDVSNTVMSNILSNLMPASAYNVFLPLYYPKRYSTGYDLFDVSSINCNTFSTVSADQRGIQRVIDATLLLTPDQRNLCEIGSVEVMNLTAADVQDLKNTSLVTLVDSYEKIVDQLKKDIEDPNFKQYKIANQDDLSEMEPYLNSLKANLKYRAIYFDPFKLALASEKTTDASGNQIVKRLDADHYNVSVKTLGLGTDLVINSGIPTVVNTGADSDLVCEWNSSLKQVVLYRTSGAVSAPGVIGYCTYTLTDKENPTVTSSGILKSTFNNIAPVAVSDEYSISSNNNLTVSVNPLENDHDHGDGPENTVPAGKKIWFQNALGQNTAIKFDTIPAGLNFKAEFSGPCPEAYARETCYGGNIEFSVKNNLSQFDYPVKYSVFDSEGTESNQATITLKNAAKNTNTSSSGGGGSMGVLGVFALMGLAVFRRKSKA
ncbi:CSLREA domain-containing protein [Acinetobacter sp. SwsAc6]|jgi:CSLREA domain-containing protein|uniref:CSLREA domain-containing protein n=1 Tax=Acinetobacter sp. SwsAc6 TaxID=2749439 RepID=UPI0015BD2643|nr:CSLREA domain-containing protein [Acinetobacter sp. SwsAc6]NWK73968.1 CSLREA domain-containing protein [Acinetobacter sp. SwsAc6]